MIDVLLGVWRESILLLNEMSVFLIFGFVFAGILHVFLKEGVVAKYLGSSNVGSVVKASLLGIPLPLCSCSVIPAAMSLKREGASKGSIISFLVSTPTTSIDSIFVTYSLIGGLFTFFRILGSFIIAVVAGISANIFLRNEEKNYLNESKEEGCECSHHNKFSGNSSFYEKVKGGLRYAFVDLVRDSGLWLLFGIFIGGAISYFVPDVFIEKYMGSLWLSMFVMLIIGIPMYVCSAGSVPIAAALMLKGLNPGAAFVFLMSGPATNVAALSVLLKEIGWKAVIILLISVVIGSLSLGYVLNSLWVLWDINIVENFVSHSLVIPTFIKAFFSFFLIFLIFINFLTRKK